MGELLNNPAVSGMLLLVALAIGGRLIKVLTLWSAKLSQLIALTNQQTTKIDSAAVTATKTETLVNNQRSELKAELEQLRTKLEASHLAATVAADTASKLAVQTGDGYGASGKGGGSAGGRYSPGTAGNSY